jgi:DNA ligase 1
MFRAASGTHVTPALRSGFDRGACHGGYSEPFGFLTHSRAAVEPEARLVRLGTCSVMTLLADVVAASAEVTDTSSRARKVAILSELLERLEPSEIPAAVGFLAGVPRQGRVGIGYRTIYGIQVAAADVPSLTVGDLDRAIADVRATTGSGSAAERKQLLAELLGQATDAEADFVRRLFTADLRQGALAGLMVDAIAKAAGVSGSLTRRALMLSGDLTRTAEIAIREGEEGLRAVGFQIFRPIFPMLASPAASVSEAVASFDAASVEWKIDGIRVQIHRCGDEIRIYTRNLNEITHALPGIVAAVRDLPVSRAVFDGEALWMSDDGPAPFQDTVSQIDSAAPPEGVVTFLFDLLHVDGDDLLDTPLEERAARLDAVASHLKIPSVLTSDPGTAERVIDDALSAGHEGVVVKDARSLYSAGRRGKAWRKVKPVQTYDFVVLGAEWGHGRRRGWLSNLHLGARDPSTESFLMVGKCFKGLTDELLEWQTKELLARETERRGIAVLVRPELVVEIALDGVQSSTRYPGGVALRFARVKRYRPDKSAAEVDTIDDLRALR